MKKFKLPVIKKAYSFNGRNYMKFHNLVTGVADTLSNRVGLRYYYRHLERFWPMNTKRPLSPEAPGIDFYDAWNKRFRRRVEATLIHMGYK